MDLQSRPMSPEKLPASFALLTYSNAALDNAHSLAVEARILASHGRFIRATGLMVVAREELGKAHYSFLLATGALREKPDSIDALRRRHQKKQVMSQMIPMPFLSALAPIVQSLIAPLQQVDFSTLEGKEAARRFVEELPG